MKIGIHGRNATQWHDLDFYVIREAGIEAVKMMSLTSPGVYYRLQKENPGIELITRLYDNRVGVDIHPTAADFANRQAAVMAAVKDYCVKFEVHNEPNHPARYEGWGVTDEDADDFNEWFLEVYDRLKLVHPWASIGFPGLAIPHRDFEWLERCRPAIERADWLGVHCYWQTPPDQPRNYLTDFWGLRFKEYHRHFPGKTIEITECGNSNAQGVPPLDLSETDMARQVIDYYSKCGEFDYLNSVCFFILSSPDPAWQSFAWRDERGRLKPVVRVVGDYEKPGPVMPEPERAQDTSPVVAREDNGLSSRVRTLEARVDELERLLYSGT